MTQAPASGFATNVPSTKDRSVIKVHQATTVQLVKPVNEVHEVLMVLPADPVPWALQVHKVHEVFEVQVVWTVSMAETVFQV